MTGALAWLLLTARALAHPAVTATVLVEVSRENGVAHVRAIIVHDALAYALNDTSARVTDPQMYELLDAPPDVLAATLQDGRERFAAAFRIIADGTPVETTLTEAPTVESIDRWKADNPSMRLPCTMEFVIDAELPDGTRGLAIRAPAILGDVIATVKRPAAEPMYLPMRAGEESPGIDVRMATAPAFAAEATDTNATDAAGRPASDDAAGKEHAEPPAPRSLGALRVGLLYVRFGYEHIIPRGWDHALFVLALFLLSSRVKDVVWLITTFTIAHSVTLTLATLHILQVPASIVEPTIAATVAFVAVENLLTTKIHLWRPAVAFIFGLVHGLGFASALMDVGLPPGQLAVGIVAFSIGVEGGHLTMLAAAFTLLWWARDKPWYRKRVAMPLSACIAAVALFWMVQRVV